MANIHEIELKIKAVEFALGSFADYDNEQERKFFLKKNLTAIPGLRTYFGFSEDKLQDALNKQQDEKNLLLEKEILLLGQQQGGIFICECLNLQ